MTTGDLPAQPPGRARVWKRSRVKQEEVPVAPEIERRPARRLCPEEILAIIEILVRV